MKVAIIDDEIKSTDIIESFIKRFGIESDILLITEIWNNPYEFLDTNISEFDIILLDIEMPGINGIEVARELRKRDSKVVIMFITNMAQYAINGYEVEAIDFVLKPITYSDFYLKLQKAVRYKNKNKDESIVLNTRDLVVNVYLSDIKYIEIKGHYLIYHTIKENYTIRGTLKDLEVYLKDYNFVRSNHWYIVNLKYIEMIEKSHIVISGEKLQISRSKRAELMTEFVRYIGGI